MHDVRLGSTGLDVSKLALGTWSYGGDWGAVDVDGATRTIHRALELGITLFDTAQAYGFGQAERILADALWSQVERDKVVVATKGGLRKDRARTIRDASALWLRQGVEESLRNLRTDYIDLYQVHWPDPATSAAETGAVLSQLMDEGKIRHIGVSNYDVGQIHALRQHATVSALQPPYHLFRREIEAELLPYCSANDIGVLVYGALAHGLLGGAITAQTTFAPDDWRATSPDFSAATLSANLAVVEQLRVFASERQMSLAQLALAWTVAHPAVDVTIIGARHPDHLDESVDAIDVKLGDDDLGDIDRIMTRARPVHGPAPEGMPESM